MFYAKQLSICFLTLALLSITSCDIGDDLFPDDSDLRSRNSKQLLESQPGESMIEFSLKTLSGDTITADDIFADDSKQSVVVYFTMWCSICNSHSYHLKERVISDYPDHSFILVDWVNSTMGDTEAMLNSSGLQDTFDWVALDNKQTMVKNYAGGMATMVVIDSERIIRMNEAFKDASRLETVLEKIEDRWEEAQAADESEPSE